MTNEAQRRGINERDLVAVKLMELIGAMPDRHQVREATRVDTANQAQDVPFPGSDEAIKRGCSCPVLDNNHGKFPPWPASDQMPTGGWWINTGCPVHPMRGASDDG